MVTQFSGNYFVGSCVFQAIGGAMFDYVSAQEIQLLRKLRARGSEVYVTSDQRIRLELLGLVTDGANGIRLTAKGLRVVEADYDAEGRSEFEPLIVRLAG
jgi:hypothetical protein